MAGSKTRGEVAVEITGDSAKLKAELAKAQGMLKKFGHDLHTIAEITKVAFAFEVGAKLIEGLKKIGEEFGKLAVAGEKAASVQHFFKELGGTTDQLEKAKEATHGVIDSFQLMALENKGLIAQGPAFNKYFSDIVKVATHTAQATGKDIPTAIASLENALIKGNKKGLAPFGISLGNVKRGAETTIEGLKALTEEAAKIAPEADSAGKAFEALEATIRESKTNFGIGIDSSDQLREAYRNLIAIIESFDWKKFGEEAAAAAGTILNAFSKTLPYLISGFEKVANFISGGTLQEQSNTMLGQLIAMQQQGRNGTPEFQKLAAEYNKLNAQIAAETQKRIEDELEERLNADDEAFANQSAHLKAEGVLKQEQDAKAAKEAEKQQKKLHDSQMDMYDAEKKLQQDAYKESIEFWTSTFENAITGVTFNLSDALSQVAVGFAAQLAASLTGISFSGGVQGLGISLANSVLGSIGGGSGLGGLAESLIFGGSAAGAAGGAGILGSFGAGLTGTATVPASAAASSALNIGATIAPAMPYIAAAVGTYMVAKHFGLFGSGPTNPETLARFDAQDKINQMTGRNLDFGPSNRFNPGQGGFDFFNQMGTEGKNSFGGLGTALQELLGLTEDVGPQIGAILSEELSGNLDEAKKLTRELGFSMEEMKAAVIKAGLAMGKTWLEIQGQLQGIDDMFTPGRSGKGDIAGAFQSIIDSGGEGTGVLVDIRDAAIEAGEAGITSFEGLAAELKKTFSESDVNIFFQTISDMGITNLDQLKNASDEMAIAFVAHLDALGFGFAELKDNIDAATDSINELNDAASDTPVTGSSTTSSGTTVKKNARGGIINTRTMFGYGGKLGLMGEMGPEAILPLTRVGGKLGVAARLGDNKTGSGMTFVIDARGAAPGVEHQIERAMRAMQSEVMRDTARLIHRSNFDAGRVRGFE